MTQEAACKNDLSRTTDRRQSHPRILKIFLEMLYHRSRDGKELDQPKTYPCRDGRASIGKDCDQRQPAIWVATTDPEMAFDIRAEPGGIDIMDMKRKVMTTIETDGTITICIPDKRMIQVHSDGRVTGANMKVE